MPKLRKKISASGREMRQRLSLAGVNPRPTKMGVARARDVPSPASRASPYESESKLSHSKFGLIRGEKAVRAIRGPRLRKL